MQIKVWEKWLKRWKNPLEVATGWIPMIKANPVFI